MPEFKSPDTQKSWTLPWIAVFPVLQRLEMRGPRDLAGWQTSLAKTWSFEFSKETVHQNTRRRETGEASSCQRLSSTHGQMGLCTHAHSFLTQNQTQRKMKHDGNWEVNKDAMIKVRALETMKTVYCFRQNKTRVSKKIIGTTWNSMKELPSDTPTLV